MNLGCSILANLALIGVAYAVFGMPGVVVLGIILVFGGGVRVWTR
jgi:hypothetical protein